MIHFIRLTRPLNMIIIALTMYGLGWFFDGMLKDPAVGIRSLDFFLLVFSTTLIAAAGNIINDYFDRKADRINKPEKLIIGKFVKRRIAIVTHVFINLIAFSIAAYLSWKLETFGYVFIHLMTINMLWFYSMYFKRKFLIGNIMIAGMTALVPLLVGFYYDQSISSGALEVSNFNDGLTFISVKIMILVLSVVLGGFAFIINLGREIIKDMEDVPGDEVLKARTIPIVLGIKSSRWIVTVILLFAAALTVLLVLMFPNIGTVGFLPLFTSGILVVVAIITIFLGDTKQHYKLANNWLKLAMVAGLITPVIWRLLFYYDA
ncbi:MAG: geranylgeranylglycerol-phosphate geranylgeranyltransferase [bacterium]|nr:geranylgeranylglycerol-phosphate geranylgeranyltransferase [bacterium]